MRNKEITVLEKEIHINKDDYFSLTDMLNTKIPKRLPTLLRIGLDVKTP